MKKLITLFVATVIAATMALPAMSQDSEIIAGSPSLVAKLSSQHVPTNVVVAGTWTTFPSSDAPPYPVGGDAYTFSNHGTISVYHDAYPPPPSIGSYWITGSHITAVMVNKGQNLEESFSGVVNGDTMNLHYTRIQKLSYGPRHQFKKPHYRYIVTHYDMTLYRWTPYQYRN